MDNFSVTSLIIDGLDECGDTIGEILDHWLDLCTSSSGFVRTIILSRDIDAIKRRLTEAKFSSLSIAAESSDINLYVAAEIETRCRREQLLFEDQGLKGVIMDKLVEKPQGM
jgi:hypothetical protein